MKIIKKSKLAKSAERLIYVTNQWFSIFFLFFLKIYFMYMIALLAFMGVYHIGAWWPRRPKEGVRSPFPARSLLSNSVYVHKTYIYIHMCTHKNILMHVQTHTLLLI